MSFNCVAAVSDVVGRLILNIMVCIYHNKDLDGYCSGAIVKHRFPEVRLIGYDYGLPFPWDDIMAGEPVIMIDVSLPMPDMLKLAEHTNFRLTWIDHHISAINDYIAFLYDGRGFDGFCVAVLENGIAACEGGWKYLFPEEQMPLAIKLIGEYDTWRNQDSQRWDFEIMPFQYGMRMICNSPETFPEYLFSVTQSPLGVVGDCIKNGELILKYQKQQNTRTAQFSFETTFEGLRAICLNSGGANSQLFESVYDEAKHDIMIPMFYSGRGWTFSLYTTKDEIDCSVIAKKYGGGGHKKAAGFKLAELPNEFKLLPKK